MGGPNYFDPETVPRPMQMKKFTYKIKLNAGLAERCKIDRDHTFKVAAETEKKSRGRLFLVARRHLGFSVDDCDSVDGPWCAVVSMNAVVIRWMR